MARGVAGRAGRHAHPPNIVTGAAAGCWASWASVGEGAGARRRRGGRRRGWWSTKIYVKHGGFGRRRGRPASKGKWKIRLASPSVGPSAGGSRYRLRAAAQLGARTSPVPCTPGRRALGHGAAPGSGPRSALWGRRAGAAVRVGPETGGEPTTRPAGGAPAARPPRTCRSAGAACRRTRSKHARPDPLCSHSYMYLPAGGWPLPHRHAPCVHVLVLVQPAGTTAGPIAVRLLPTRLARNATASGRH